ncbi:aspartyl protease family protein [Chitinimonas sp.]|uniref:aspartyl protease family protein n=1 Tax=Chitinimonas sp. TaxID=1934313 RepID=UPI002F928D4A
MRLTRLAFASLLIVPLAQAAVDMAPGGIQELPFYLLNQQPVIEAQVGSTKARLMLDLGAHGEMMLTSHLIQQLGIQPGEAVTTLSDHAGNALPNRLYPPLPVTLAGRELGQLAATEFPRESRYDGLIGMGYFKHYRIKIDYPQLRMTLFPPTEKPAFEAACQGKVLPLGRQGDLLYLTAETELGPLKLALDTGANMNVINQTALQGAAASRIDPQRRYAFDTFILTDQPYRPGKFYVLQSQMGSIQGFLGYEFFKDKTVCLDMEATTAYIATRSP